MKTLIQNNGLPFYRNVQIAIRKQFPYVISALLVILMLCRCSESYSQIKKDYFIGFFAEKINIDGPVGHAFIGIGKGTPMTCNIDGSETEMYGFYPKAKLDGAKSYWFGPVEGKVKKDVRTRIDQYIFLKIDFADYLKVQLKMEDWKKKQYELGRQDCISFFIDVASLFDEIKLPDRTQYILPDKYVSTFIFLNK